MKRSSIPRMRLLPSTMFGRLAASLLLVVGITLAVFVALILRDRGELSMRVGGIGDSSHRIAFLTRSRTQAPEGRHHAESRARTLSGEGAAQGGGRRDRAGVRG